MTPPDSGERCVICRAPATRGLREADPKYWCSKHGPFYDKPDSGEREVRKNDCVHGYGHNGVLCPHCHERTISLPLSLAQRILAALEDMGDMAMAKELRARIPR